MKSNWIPSNQANNIPRANAGALTKIIDEQIDWYEKNATRLDDDYIKAHLNLIKNLAENIESSEEIMFLEKIIMTMCEIIEVQRGVISNLEMQASQQAIAIAPPHNNVTFYTASAEGFSDDEQVKAVFTAYMKNEGKSDFTINDYILRIQNLWRSFYSDYINGELPHELAESVREGEIKEECPLLNAYHYIEELNCYVSMKIAASDDDRNLANVRASLNKFGKAVYGDAYVKSKSEQKKHTAKDFSKYLFDGQTFGKSRLVLAVVKRYVLERRPTTFAELEKAFPGELQGSLGVVKLIDSVSDKYKGIGGIKRYFVNDDEIIKLESGEKAIVCTQWGTNMDRFIDHAVRELGYEIEKV